MVGTVCLIPSPAVAYLGPGGGLTAIGSLLALLAAVAFAICGFVWYPLKRLMRKKQQSMRNDKSGGTDKIDI